MSKRSFVGLLALLFVSLSSSAFALNITLNDIGGVGPGTDARAGFETAASRWATAFSDPVTVRLDVGFQSLAPGVLGQASSGTVGRTYTNIRTALIGDQRSSDDATAVGNLENQAGFRFITNNPLSPGSGFILNNAGFAMDTVLDVPRANAKALGLLADDFAADATIQFSSNFAFDFNRSNGISAGTFDFVGIAAHEIGHALGFVSGVDIIDLVSFPNGPYAGCCSIGFSAPQRDFDLLDFPIFSVLDLYRYSDFSVEAGLSIIGAPARDLTWGDTSFFSLDRGATNLGLFSTGAFNGDGRQASHWKDSLGLGIMDPTVAPGEFLQITSLDTRAFDVTGWDLVTVPEPASILLFGSGLAGLGLWGRRASWRALP